MIYIRERDFAVQRRRSISCGHEPNRRALHRSIFEDAQRQRCSRQRDGHANYATFGARSSSTIWPLLTMAPPRQARSIWTTAPLTGEVGSMPISPISRVLPLPVGASGSLDTSGQRPHREVVDRDRGAQPQRPHDREPASTLKTLVGKASGTLDALRSRRHLRRSTHPAVGVVERWRHCGADRVKGGDDDLRLDGLIGGARGPAAQAVAPVTLYRRAQSARASKGSMLIWGEEGRFTGSAERTGDNLKASLKIANFEPPQVPGADFRRH